MKINPSSTGLVPTSIPPPSNGLPFQADFFTSADSSRLTERETQVVALIVSGKKLQVIADELGIHLGTVRFHVGNAKRKTGKLTLVTLSLFFVRQAGEKVS